MIPKASANGTYDERSQPIENNLATVRLRRIMAWLHERRMDRRYGKNPQQGISTLAVPDFCGLMAGLWRLLFVPEEFQYRHAPA